MWIAALMLVLKLSGHQLSGHVSTTDRNKYTRVHRFQSLALALKDIQL